MFLKGCLRPFSGRLSENGLFVQMISGLWLFSADFEWLCGAAVMKAAGKMGVKQGLPAWCRQFYLVSRRSAGKKEGVVGAFEQGTGKNTYP